MKRNAERGNMERLTLEGLNMHINECKRRIDCISKRINTISEENKEDCHRNLLALENTVNAIEVYIKIKELEEQGLLLKLPCKVGDTLYRIDTDENIENAEIEPYTIENIVICRNGDVLFKYDAYDGVICHLENIITDKPYLDFYRVFLTKEEAEQKLKEVGQDLI